MVTRREGCFYVYTLIDPRDDVVFYVGKGKGSRMYQHAAEAKAGRVVNPDKHARIMSILDAGHEVRCAKVASYRDEDEAFSHEIRLIAEIGLDRLTNIMPGGQGRSPMTPEERGQAALRYKAARLMPKVIKLAERFAIPGTFPFERDGVRMGREYSDALKALISGEQQNSYSVPDDPDALQVLLGGACVSEAPMALRMEAAVFLGDYCMPHGHRIVPRKQR